MPETKINFVGDYLPDAAATTHFCFIGATGSGKSVCIRLLMQSVLHGGNDGEPLHRALVYDAKSDALPVLHRMVKPDNYDQNEPHRVVTLNPFDRRSYAWNVAADITTPGHALQMATILIPPDENASQPFFANAARHLLYGVLTVFIRSKKHWTLRDVMCAMTDAKRLCAVLESDPLTKRLVELYFSHVETAKNIMSELASRLAAFEIIAALWHKAESGGRTVSLNEWLNGSRKFILVLGSDATNRAALDAVNQVIFKRLSELVLAQPDDAKRRTWFFIDEFVRAGRLSGAVELATAGRSKGACLVVGFQDINGARAVYGKEVAEEIIGQCTNIAVLRLQSPETAEWASRLFGQYEQTEAKKGQSRNYGQEANFSRSENEEIVKRELFLASQFMYLPMTNAENGLSAFRYSPFLESVSDGSESGRRGGEKGAVKTNAIDGTLLFGAADKSSGERSGGLLWKPLSEKGVDLRAADEQYLSDWERHDYERLGLSKILRSIEIEKKRQEVAEKEKLVRELAELAFLRGFPSVPQLKRIARFSVQERKAFFQVLGEYKKSKLFFGASPMSEQAREFDGCGTNEKDILDEIVLFLNEDSPKKKSVKKAADAFVSPSSKKPPPTREFLES